MLLAYDPVTETVDTIQQIIGEGGINGGFRPFVLNDSTLLFSSQVLGAQAGLYQTDGTREGTSLILAGSMSSARFIGFDGAAFVIISDQAVSDIWRTDGTPTGTQRLSSGNSLRNLQNMTVIGDRLYFIASGFASQGLYYFSTSSTQINQINPPNGASLNNLSNLLNYNGQLFFTGDLSGSGIELLTTDGTSAGTRLVKDIVEGEESGHPRDFVVANDILYFSAFNPSSGRELYHSDGTTEGTQLIADINPGPASGSPDYLYNYRGVIYFSADDGLSGAELWRYSPADPTATDEANNPNDVVESCPDTTTNLNEVLPPSTLTISPNPARGQTIIDLSPGVFRLELYSATGQILWSSNRQTGRAELDLSQQAAGNYFLRVIEATTGRHRVEKLVVLR
jgi:ELWxxDGT repeat protein